MRIMINGKEREFEKSISIAELIKVEGVEMPDMVSVELNGEFLDREAFETITIKENDKIEFLYFMGGGAVEF